MNEYIIPMNKISLPGGAEFGGGKPGDVFSDIKNGNIYQKTMTDIRRQTGENSYTTKNRGRAKDELVNEFENDMRDAPTYDKMCSVCNTYIAVVKWMTDTLNHGANCSKIPDSKDIDGELFARILNTQRMRENLELICCHRNIWIGDPNYKSDMLGTNYTKHANSLIAFMSRSRPGIDRNLMSEISRLARQTDPFEVHNGLAGMEKNPLIEGVALPVPGKTDKDWLACIQLARKCNSLGSKCIEDMFALLIENSSRNAYVNSAKSYIFSAYNEIANSNIPAELKRSLYGILFSISIFESATAYDGKVSCMKGVMERAQEAYIYVRQQLAPLSAEQVAVNYMAELVQSIGDGNCLVEFKKIITPIFLDVCGDAICRGSIKIGEGGNLSLSEQVLLKYFSKKYGEQVLSISLRSDISSLCGSPAHSIFFAMVEKEWFSEQIINVNGLA